MEQSLALLGLNHKSAPLDIRERLALLSASELAKRIKAEGTKEAAVLSTCNRFEVYFMPAGEAVETVGNRITALLEQISGAALSRYAYRFGGEDAVKHLFEVSSGLDSLVVGESEILGQVKDAYETARAADMTGKYFNVLFQRALYVGKKVRSETGVAIGQTSVASVSVQLAHTIFGGLQGATALVVGAGSMAETTARHLISQKILRLTVVNRTWEKARALAAQFLAEAVPWDSLPSALERADIVIASTSAERPILTREMIQEAAKTRQGRSLFILDIAMPRNVEEGAHGIDHVYVYRLEDLESVVADNMKKRGVELDRARGIVSEKVREFGLWEKSLGSGREASFKHSDIQEPSRIS
ncbi:MAG TPA: glutamyl-tRNA reductase [Elusimicrobiota bacterium]|nr:glutamyl-tRNA reductase [Elusimicrobiota bacterium]